ncbi:hypothetical protein L7F22_029495 [Adiantum nelumboides]|nr:hypothetical protein [Adiantum nelumboides]
MAGGTAAGKGKGKAKGEMRGKYSSPKAKQGRAPGPKTCLQITRQAGVSEEEGPAPPMQSLAKLSIKGGRASVTDTTTEAQALLILERRTKLTAKDRQAVPRSCVGDEAEADAKNNQGADKPKGTTSEAMRSLKPHVQSIAKTKVGVEQQKEIAEPSKVPSPTERNKAKKKQGLGKGKEKAVYVGSQKPHEDILAQKTQGSEIQKETAGSSKDPRMQKKKTKKKPGSEKPIETAMSSEVVGSQIIHENSIAKKKQGLEKGKIPLLIEFSRMLLEENRAAELPKPNVDGTGNEKAKQQQAKKTKRKSSLVKPTEKVQVLKEVKKPKGNDTSAAPNLSKASEQPVKWKLPLQAATLGSPSKRVKVGSSGLEGEEERGEEEEKFICEEGEEEEDEEGDEEGVDDEEEGGEKAEEEGRESDEDNKGVSDGEKTDEGDGSTGMMKIARMMGRVAGMMRREMRKGIVQKAWMEAMKGTG